MNRFKYVLFIAASILMLLACSTTYIDKRDSSQYFSNGVFHNPVSKDFSSWSAFKMLLNTTYADWPDWIDTDYQILDVSVNPESTVLITHINHSTVLIQTQGINIITDPIFSKRTSPISWLGPSRVRNPGIRQEDLPKIDIVLISHDHYDHLDLPSLKFIADRDNPKIYMGLGVGSILTNVKNVIELDWWDSNVFNQDITVNFVPVQHFSGRSPFNRNGTQWGGFVIETGSKKIYFGGDTGYANHFKETREKFGPMDVSLIPIGAYLPRDFMAYAHMNPLDAVQAHIDLESSVSLGIHYGTFQLTAEEIDAPIIDLLTALLEKNISPNQFITPEFGQTVTVK